PTPTPTPATANANANATVAAISKSKDTPRNLYAKPLDETEAAKRAKEKLQRAVKKQLEYMDDPWKIGKYVEKALAKDRYDEALLLTQMASRDQQLVVSWNHLINYMLEKQQLRQALKLHNDMKKRAQLPNLQTYTIMFRGFAKSQHPKLAVSEAIKQYQKLLKDTRLEPNSIHLNSVLNVCGRAGDLDSMFSIVDTINESTRSPTAYTYTTIINALRFHVQSEIKDLPLEQQNANLENAIRRGKTVWEEAVYKWRQGRLVIDEPLVCAMGRLLLLAPDRVVKREVLDVLEQAMNIPNISKMKPDDSASVPSSKPSEPPRLVHKDGRGIYATPDRNTLSLILTTLASSRMSTIGIKYWNLLVREYKIVPDLDSWMRLFGMLKMARASAHASEIVEMIPDEYLNPRFYHMAMEACVRDNININTIKNANRALESMQKRLPLPDPHTMRLYLRAVQVSHYHLRSQANQGDVAGAKRAYGLQISDALERLWVPYEALHKHYFTEVVGESEKDRGLRYNSKREVIALARIMYGSFNKVLQQKMLPPQDLHRYHQIGGRINRQIGEFYANREETEPNLRPKGKGRGGAEEEMSEYKDDDDEAGYFWDTTQAGKPRKAENNYQPRRGDEYSSGRRNRHESERGDDFKPRRRDDSGRKQSSGPEFKRTGDPRQRRASLQW
ncbi:hypothetical protein FZEAL_9896, partial [Fusarium zealandicum]